MNNPLSAAALRSFSWRAVGTLVVIITTASCVSGEQSSGGTGGAMATGGVNAGSGGTPPTTGTGGTAAAPAGTGGRPTATGGATVIGGGATGTGGRSARVDLTGKKVLLVLESAGTLDEGDIALRDALQNRGMNVAIGDATAPASDASAMDLIVGASAPGVEFASLYGGLAVAMITFGPNFPQALGHAAAGSANRGANVSATTPSTITDSSTTLAAAFSTGTNFTIIGTDRSTQYSWGLPGGNVIKIAAVMGMPSQVTVFAYEKGAPMGIGTAAGRRVWFGWKVDAVPDLGIEAFRLMNAALDWTAGASP